MKKGALLGLLLTVITSAAWAQGCAVCTKVAAGLDSKQAKGLNGGIIYLAFLPLILMGTVGLVWWKYNKNS
jgi:hypothetical protein